MVGAVTRCQHVTWSVTRRSAKRPDAECGVQSIEDIQRIVQEAQQAQTQAPGWDDDEYIDDTMENDDYEVFDEWGQGQGQPA